MNITVFFLSYCLIVLLTWKEWNVELELEWSWIERGKSVFNTVLKPRFKEVLL